jgi:hypothetical protein
MARIGCCFLRFQLPLQMPASDPALVTKLALVKILVYQTPWPLIPPSTASQTCRPSDALSSRSHNLTEYSVLCFSLFPFFTGLGIFRPFYVSTL